METRGDTLHCCVCMVGRTAWLMMIHARCVFLFTVVGLLEGVFTTSLHPFDLTWLTGNASQARSGTLKKCL